MLMPTAATRLHRLNSPRTNLALGCALLWSLSCLAEDAPPPPSAMRAEAIAGFSYNSKPHAGPEPTAGIPAPNAPADPVESNVVAMAPMIVHGDRGLTLQQYRTVDSSLQDQRQAAAAQKWSIVKVHDVKISRKFHFGYVTILGVPVVAGFSW
jgi:hypothetical protein